MAKFKDKVTVITGAGRGIGRELALLFAREGARVVVNDLGGGPKGGGGDQEVAQSVVDEIEAIGGKALAETSSIDSFAGASALISATADTYGRIDYLINNAGILRPKPIDEMTEQDVDQVLAVNLKGFFATIRHAAPYLKRQGGAIVNLSSPSGWGHYGMSNYAAAKEGVVGLTRSVARDLGPFNVRCNAVRPIAANSAMAIPEVLKTLEYATEKLGIPHIANQYLKASGPPAIQVNAAAAIAWLCTEHSAPINGRELYICGGQISLVQDPELIRSQFCENGWDFDGLCKEEIGAALTYGLRNPYLGIRSSES